MRVYVEFVAALTLLTTASAFNSEFCDLALGPEGEPTRAELPLARHARHIHFSPNAREQEQCATCKTLTNALIQDLVGSFALQSCKAPTWMTKCMLALGTSASKTRGCGYVWGCLAQRSDVEVDEAAHAMSKRLQKAASAAGSSPDARAAAANKLFARLHRPWQSACTGKAIADKLISKEKSKTLKVGQFRRVHAVRSKTDKETTKYANLKQAWMAEVFGKTIIDVCIREAAAFREETDALFPAVRSAQEAFETCRHVFSGQAKTAMSNLAWQAVEFGCYTRGPVIRQGSKEILQKGVAPPLHCPAPVICRMLRHKAGPGTGCSTTSKFQGFDDRDKKTDERLQMCKWSREAYFPTSDFFAAASVNVYNSCPAGQSTVARTPSVWERVGVARSKMHKAILVRQLVAESKLIAAKYARVQADFNKNVGTCQGLARDVQSQSDYNTGKAADIPSASEAARLGLKTFTLVHPPEVDAWKIQMEKGTVVCTEVGETRVSEASAQLSPDGSSVADFVASVAEQFSSTPKKETALVKVSQTHEKSIRCTLEVAQDLPVRNDAFIPKQVSSPRCGDYVDCSCPDPLPARLAFSAKRIRMLPTPNQCAISEYFNTAVISSLDEASDDVLSSGATVESERAALADAEAQLAALENKVDRLRSLGSLLAKEADDLQFAKKQVLDATEAEETSLDITIQSASKDLGETFLLWQETLSTKQEALKSGSVAAAGGAASGAGASAEDGADLDIDGTALEGFDELQRRIIRAATITESG